jgi:cellulose synthase/poly-beta-1,6-N-acetylglucosamine synthase-like glycosyltransferase
MEATAIAMRKGYHVGYEPSVVVKTFVPQNFRDFYNQRKRWDLGALETYEKEHHFYTQQMKDYRNRLGQITILDWYSWITTFLLPYWLFSGVQHLELLGCYELIEVAFAAILGYIARKEFQSRIELLIAPLLPFYRILQVIPRVAAVCRFLRAKVPVRIHLGWTSLPILNSSAVAFSACVFGSSRLASITQVPRVCHSDHRT